MQEGNVVSICTRVEQTTKEELGKASRDVGINTSDLLRMFINKFLKKQSETLKFLIID